MLNVLVVDDDRQIAESIMQYLEMAGAGCDYACDGLAALRLVSESAFDVLVVDVSMPRLDGLRLCQEIRNRGVSTPVLMVTARDTLEDKLSGFDAGADDYLVKPFAMKELHARVKALAGRRSGATTTLQVGDLVMNLAQRTLVRGGVPVSVSPLGWRILEVLMRASPAVVHRQELERAVWNDSPPQSDALRVHLHHLRMRIDKPFGKPLIRNVGGRGLVIRADD